MSEANASIPSTAEVYDKTQAVANQAAESAQHTYNSAQHHAPPHQAPPHQGGSHLKEDFEEFERELKATTDKVTRDGKEDVTAATASYLEQALHIADTGLSTAQSYVGAGKERLTAPQGAHPPTGLAASLSATAASALDALSSGLGMAHTQLHANAPHNFQQSHPHPHNAVTSPTKPIGQAVSDNVSAVGAAAQPYGDAAKFAAQAHYEAAQSAVQPHVDAAAAAAQPHIDNTKAAAQPHIDAAKSTYNDVAQQAQDAAQPTIDAAKSTVNDIQSSDKSYAQQAQEVAQPHIDAVKDAAQSYGRSAEDKDTTPSVDTAKPPAGYPANVESTTQV
ncbi:hypothetical protein FRB93_006876 [Tulasnella sp. JGI-2019a]|nr:hypothetical protein FRB93_006876 [Tulasnella sp. JGI-2019a]